MKKSFAKRIKITKGGKILRRLMAVDHFKSKNSGHSRQSKRKLQRLGYPNLKMIKLANTHYKIAK